MPYAPPGHKSITLYVPNEVHERLDLLRQEISPRTFQNLLKPVVSAFSRGEIRREFVQGAEAANRSKPH